MYRKGNGEKGMKGKHLKTVLRSLCAAAAIFIVGMALMSAAAGSEAAVVKNLLEKRCTVMSNVLEGKLTYDEGKRLLKEVEEDKLYSDDLKALEEYTDTDLDMMKKNEDSKGEKGKPYLRSDDVLCRDRVDLGGLQRSIQRDMRL